MNIRKKHIIITVCISFVSIVLAVLALSLRLFTDTFGKPKYIRIESYAEKSFMKIDEVEDLWLHNPSEFTLKNIKYCNKLNHLIIVSFTGLDDLSFLSDLNITSLTLWIKCSDWGGISELKKLRKLQIYHSDFSDLSLLSDMTELEELTLQTTASVNFLDLSDLINLNSLAIDVGNNDISDVSKLTNLKKLDLYRCNNVNDFSFLKRMDEVEELRLDRLCIYDYSFLFEMNSLKCLDLFEQELNDNMISDLQNKGVTVIVSSG